MSVLESISLYYPTKLSNPELRLFPQAQKPGKWPQMSSKQSLFGKNNLARRPMPQDGNAEEGIQTDAIEPGTHTISLPRFHKNEKGEWVYGLWHNFGKPFQDTRFNKRLRYGILYTQPRMGLDPWAPVNYYVTYVYQNEIIYRYWITII